MGIHVRHTITVSRPGFYTTQLWFYLLPLGGYRLLEEWTFWLGAFYVMFPLGLLLYGWNDLHDFRTDRANPRKGNLLFGAKSSDSELHSLPLRIAAVQAPLWLAFWWIIGPKFLLWIAATLAVNAAYNSERFNFKGRPWLDLANQTGYLLVFAFSSWINDVPQLPWQAFVFGALFAMHSHLLGQIMDFEPDRAAGRRTTAVVIGMVPAKLLLALLLGVESVFAHIYFQTPPVTLFLAAGCGAFLLNVAVRREASLAMQEMKLLMVGWNVAAVASMYWVWRTGVFVAVAAR